MSEAVELSDLDRRLLCLLSSQRVLTQAQLVRLLSEVPDRTLRYRTARLYRLGLVGRSRPYRERGSAPFHLWPTRRGDALARGDPPPRGGERREPNPLFLAHAAALSELYVALTTVGPEVGLQLRSFAREGQAREEFHSLGKRRAITPDALAILADGDERELRLFAEVDLGTMSHRRLRRKASGYAAYASERAWDERHPFCPALCFLTTTEQRAEAFLRGLRSALSEMRVRDAWVAAAAGPVALAPGRALLEPVLIGLDEARLTLTQLLKAARAPYERERAAREAERREREQGRRRLLEDPEALRAFVAEHEYSLRFCLSRCGEPGERALQLLLGSGQGLDERERAALRALARDLEPALPDLAPIDRPTEPSAEVEDALAALADSYAERQLARVRELFGEHGEGPSLRGARQRIETRRLLSDAELEALAGYAERDERGRADQAERRTWSCASARPARWPGGADSWRGSPATAPSCTRRSMRAGCEYASAAANSPTRAARRSAPYCRSSRAGAATTAADSRQSASTRSARPSRARLALRRSAAERQPGSTPAWLAPEAGNAGRSRSQRRQGRDCGRSKGNHRLAARWPRRGRTVRQGRCWEARQWSARPAAGAAREARSGARGERPRGPAGPLRWSSTEALSTVTEVRRRRTDV
jgi:hypothetical protein